MVLANLFLGGIVKDGISRVALLTTESLKKLSNSWSGGSRFVDGTLVLENTLRNLIEMEGPETC